jgi:hypothetical protein
VDLVDIVVVEGKIGVVDKITEDKFVVIDIEVNIVVVEN